MRSFATTESSNQLTTPTETNAIAPSQANVNTPSISHAKTKSPVQRLENTIAGGVRIGLVAAFSEAGPLVDFDGNPTDEPLPACSCVRITPREIGRSTILAFEENALCRPVIIGLVEECSSPAGGRSLMADESQASETAVSGDDKCVAVEADGRRLVVSAEQELVFRCGKASVTLTKAGKILIRGTYLLSRSAGVNRIVGGSVQIN
jgi:hypothetical protein